MGKNCESIEENCEGAKSYLFMSSYWGICKMGIWWAEDFRGGHFGMSITKVAQLHKQGLRTMGTFGTPTLKLSTIGKKIKIIMGLKKVRKSFGKGS